MADRRVRKTRTSLIEAFLGLVVERGYEHVTVQDILDRADVGRSTFYAHFRDKEALLMSCFDGLRDGLSAEFDVRTPSIALFNHAYRHRPVYRALCGRAGGTLVQRHLHALIGIALRTHLEPHPAAAGSSLPAETMAETMAEAVSEFYTSALLGLLIWWVGQDFKGGPDAIARLYGALAEPGIAAAYGVAKPEASRTADPERRKVASSTT
jgi:AcrR family transcriptional regulator